MIDLRLTIYVCNYTIEKMLHFNIILTLLQAFSWLYGWLINPFKPYIIYIIYFAYITLFLYLISYSACFCNLSTLIVSLSNPTFYIYSFFITAPVLYSNIKPEYLEGWNGKLVPIYDTIKDKSRRTARPFCIENANAFRKVCCLSLPRHKSRVVAPSDSIFYEIIVGLLLGDGSIFMTAGPRSQAFTNCTAYLTIRKLFVMVN